MLADHEEYVLIKAICSARMPLATSVFVKFAYA